MDYDLLKSNGIKIVYFQAKTNLFGRKVTTFRMEAWNCYWSNNPVFCNALSEHASSIRIVIFPNSTCTENSYKSTTDPSSDEFATISSWFTSRFVLQLSAFFFFYLVSKHFYNRINKSWLWFIEVKNKLS